MGTLWATVHIINSLVKRGLLSPSELDEIYGSLIEGMEGGDPKVAAMFEKRLHRPFADMRTHAAKTYKG